MSLLERKRDVFRMPLRADMKWHVDRLTVVPSPPSSGEGVRVRGYYKVDMEVDEYHRASSFRGPFNQVSTLTLVSARGLSWPARLCLVKWVCSRVRFGFRGMDYPSFEATILTFSPEDGGEGT